MWRSLYDGEPRNEALMARHLRAEGLWMLPGPSRTERWAAQRKMAEESQAIDEVRRRRLRKEMAVNLQLQLDKARAEVETGRLRGLQDHAMQPRIMYLQNRLAEMAPQAPQVTAPGVEALLRQQIEETRAANDSRAAPPPDPPDERAVSRERPVSVDVAKQKLRELSRNSDRSYRTLTDEGVAARKRAIQLTINDLRDGSRQKEELIRLQASAYAKNDELREAMVESSLEDVDAPASGSADPIPRRSRRPKAKARS